MKKVLLVFVLLSQVSLACSYRMPSASRSYKYADVVFIGKLISIEEAPVPQDGKRQIFTFKVEESYNIFKYEKFEGAKYPETIKVYGPVSMPCGDRFNFFIGKDYLIFGNLNKASTWLVRGDKRSDLPKSQDLIITYLGLKSGVIDFENEMSREITSDLFSIKLEQGRDERDRGELPLYMEGSSLKDKVFY